MVVVANLVVKILGNASGGVLNESGILEFAILVKLNGQLERDDLESAEAVEECLEVSGRLLLQLSNECVSVCKLSGGVLALEGEHLLQLGLEQLLARESEVTSCLGLQAVAVDGFGDALVEGLRQTLSELVRDLEKMAVLETPMVQLLLGEELLQVVAAYARLWGKTS